MNLQEKKEGTIDQEWLELMRTARVMGLSTDEVRDFLGACQIDNGEESENG